MEVIIRKGTQGGQGRGCSYAPLLINPAQWLTFVCCANWTYVLYLHMSTKPYIYIILIARVRVQYGKIFYEHAKYFHEPKASENVA